MRRHRRQDQRAVLLRGQRRAVHVPLEPQHRRAEDPALGQVVAHPRLDDAEVLADDDRAGPVRLEREDADERLVVVADVGAVGRRRRPPGPTTAGTGRSRGRCGSRPRAAARCAACRGTARSRRARARRGATAAATSPAPAGCTCPAARRRSRRARARRRSAHTSAPSGCTPTARSCMMPSAMPPSSAAALRRRELLVGDPLQPRVELDPLGQLGARASRRRRTRVVRSSSGHGPAPYFSASAHHSANVSSPAPCSRDERVERGLPRGATAGAANTTSSAARLAFQAASRSMGPASESVASTGSAAHSTSGAVRRREVARLADVLDADVQRVDEAAGGRQVRATASIGADRLGRVQRVDQHEVGAELAAAPASRARRGRRGRRRPTTCGSAPSTAGP